jgi:hypothetical protein
MLPSRPYTAIAVQDHFQSRDGEMHLEHERAQWRFLRQAGRP